MKQNEQSLKQILRDQIVALMQTESFENFRWARDQVANNFKQMYIKTGDATYYNKVIEILAQITYASIVGKFADKGEELLLVLNENGTPSKEGLVLRDKVHAKGKFKGSPLLWHREVAAIVIREDGTFAIITRASEKSQGGAKALVCGHVVGDASYHEAAVSEASEELGQLFVRDNMIRLMDPKPNPREDNLAYVCPYITTSTLAQGIFLYQHAEVDGVEWIDIDRFEKMLELSKYPEFKSLVIFRDTEFYRGLIAQLKKLKSLPNWFDILTNRDYKTLYAALGVTPPEEDIAYYERTKLASATSQNTTKSPIDTSTATSMPQTTKKPIKR